MAGCPHHHRETLQPHGHAKQYWQVVEELGGFVPDLCKPDGMARARKQMQKLSVIAIENYKRRIRAK